MKLCNCDNPAHAAFQTNYTDNVCSEWDYKRITWKPHPCQPPSRCNRSTCQGYTIGSYSNL